MLVINTTGSNSDNTMMSLTLVGTRNGNGVTLKVFERSYENEFPTTNKLVGLALNEDQLKELKDYL